jgi:nitrogen fixation protein NifU and related proteins
LPPMKIHCAQLVEGALRSALEPQRAPTEKPPGLPAPGAANNPTLLDNFTQPSQGKRKITFLDDQPD